MAEERHTNDVFFVILIWLIALALAYVIIIKLLLIIIKLLLPVH